MAFTHGPSKPLIEKPLGLDQSNSPMLSKAGSVFSIYGMTVKEGVPQRFPGKLTYRKFEESVIGMHFAEGKGWVQTETTLEYWSSEYVATLQTVAEPGGTEPDDPAAVNFLVTNDGDQRVTNTGDNLVLNL